MRVVTQLEGEEITLTLIAETDVETMIVRQLNVINASRMNGNIVLVKERAAVREIKEAK